MSVGAETVVLILLCLDSPISNFQCDIHIRAFAVNVIGIHYFSIATLQDVAFAARLAVVQALPRFKHIGLPLFF